MLAGAAHRLIERVAAEGSESAGHVEPWAPARILDVGTGAGLMALDAAERWPDAAITAIDGSAAMLSLARVRAAHRWPERPDRIEWVVADAASLPLPDASVDLVLSSFVLQLVADRRAVLREMHRVLRPGGRLAFVTWLAGDTSLPPDHEFDEAVLDLDLEEPEGGTGEDDDGDRTDGDDTDDGEPDGEYADPAAARAELERCGFEAVDARLETLEHTWTRGGYAAFKERFDEWDLIESLDASDLERLRTRVAERWARLPDSAFVLRAALVSVLARRPPASGSSPGPQAANGALSSGRQMRQAR